MALTLIGHETVTTSGISYLEFTSLSQDYTHLLIEVDYADRDTSGSGVFLHLNGDTTAGNYGNNALEGAGDSSAAYAWSRSDQVGGTMLTYPTSLRLVIPNYSTSGQRHTWIMDNGPSRIGEGTAYIFWGGGRWNLSTDAITSVRLSFTGSMADGSSVTMWAYTAGSDGTTTVS